MADQTNSPADAVKLADFMCFTIYSTNLAYSRAYKQVLEKLGLTYPQYIALIALWEDGKLTVKGLAEKLYLEPSTITPMIKRLEAMGYVSRTRDLEDERVVWVSLTEAGRSLREKGFGFGKQTVAASGLAPDEFAVLQKAVARLRNNLIMSVEDDV
ncbi:MarR family winged helix-turn-helix transcriptional regulator [Roseibium sp. M-1]